jgi:hypothetical protein
MIETVSVLAPFPTGFLWFFRNGNSWSAPEINNGAPYLPTIKPNGCAISFWFCRNPIANFMGFVVGVEGLRLHGDGTGSRAADHTL